ncbi:MAG: type IV pili methyl-accepting chemotaxis transducer N-terminal domain-containing protein, partial [Pseudomonadota bacterium]
LWTKYVLALTLLFALITFSHFAVTILGADGARAATDINMSGRQRMLSQRIMYFATRYNASRFLDFDVEDGLRETVDQYIASHEALISEAERPLPAKVEFVYFDPSGPLVDNTTRQVVTAARAMLDGSYDERKAAYDALRRIGSTELLAEMERAVSAFDESAKTRATRAELWGYLGYGVAILALLLEAIFIFRPAQKTIVQVMDDLEQNNDQLKQQQAEAFAALEDSEDAWLEAEAAQQESDEILQRNSAGIAALKNELSIPYRVIARLTDQLSKIKDPVEHRSDILTLARCNAVANLTVASYQADATHDQPLEMEKERPCLPHDLAITLVAAAKAMDRSGNVTVVLEQSRNEKQKVLMQPVAALRLMLGILSHLIVEEKVTKLVVGLRCDPTEDGFMVDFEVRGEGSSVSQVEQADIFEQEAAFYDKLSTTLSALCATADIENTEEGARLVNCSWPAKSATIRTNAKGLKAASRA